MYFAPEVTRRVIEGIARSLAPGGYLFLGHAETLRGTSNRFHLRHSHGTFYYQLREEGAGGRAARASLARCFRTPPRRRSPTSSGGGDRARLGAHRRHHRRPLRATADGRARLAPGGGPSVGGTRCPARPRPRPHPAGALRGGAVAPAGNCRSTAEGDTDALLLRAVVLTTQRGPARPPRRCARGS